MRPRPRRLVHYLVAAAVTGGVITLRVLLEPLWGTEAPFLMLFPAVMLSAWIGGFGPGVLATAGGALAAAYFWLEPYRSWKIVMPPEIALLALFVIGGLALCVLTEALTRARARLDALLDATPIGLGFHDATLRYIRVNRATLTDAVLARGLSAIELPSGAGHDAGILAAAGVDAAMLFVRSLNDGVSHSPDELSSDDDVALGVDVLADALERLTSR